MAIKFENIEPGMILYDRHRERMGRTSLSGLGQWTVRIIEVDKEKRCAKVSWNGNPARTWFERDLVKLYTWSMYDPTEAELERGVAGGVRKCKRLPKAEREKRKADRDKGAKSE
jgi:hypothetical protein